MTEQQRMEKLSEAVVVRWPDKWTPAARPWRRQRRKGRRYCWLAMNRQRLSRG